MKVAILGLLTIVFGWQASAKLVAEPQMPFGLGEILAPLRSLSPPSTCQNLSGKASWYGPGFYGRVTASGEMFNPRELTAAHPTLPFGTRVRVMDLKTGRAVIVRINDRGPYKPGRILDLSPAAARVIGLSGVSPVRLQACL